MLISWQSAEIANKLKLEISQNIRILNKVVPFFSSDQRSTYTMAVHANIILATGISTTGGCSEHVSPTYLEDARVNLTKQPLTTVTLN